jgi:hypothetical protein
MGVEKDSLGNQGDSIFTGPTRLKKKKNKKFT